jgi:hypothetical protein
MTPGAIAFTAALILTAGSAAFVIAWSLASIGFDRLRETADLSQQGRGEVRGVVGVRHNGSLDK